jgi:hypothetical protein
MRSFLRRNSLSIFFLVLFLLAVGFQAVAGHADFNNSQDLHGDPRISLGRYVLSSEFGGALLENWQSEYLQFTLFILLTVWFVQQGSPESKPVDQAGRESDEKQRVGRHAGEQSPRWAKAAGLRRRIYENSLLLVMGSIWLGTWFAQSVTGLTQYNAERVGHQGQAISWGHYLVNADFWERTLENWQSEFLAVGSMAILAVYLRQRGSPESKPVGAPHHTTGTEI